MAINNSSVAIAAPELSAAMTGSFTTIGSFVESPVIVIFDNQGTVSVAISFDGGSTTWHTFPAGEAMVIDFRSNIGIAPNFTIAKGTTVSGNGASGTFSVSYFYAKDQ